MQEGVEVQLYDLVSYTYYQYAAIAAALAPPLNLKWLKWAACRAQVPSAVIYIC
jgi:hypothetical protein